MKYLIIVVGWYLDNIAFYKKLASIFNKGNIDILIASHQSEDNLSDYLRNFIEKNLLKVKIQYFPNIGYDWGAYNQAILHLGNKVLNYDYICFLHDDIEIKDDNVLDIFKGYMQQNNLKLLGNSYNAQRHPFPKTHPHIVQWMKLTLGINPDLTAWSTVRGSFFMADAKIFKEIKEIPYKTGHHSGFGNWGVIAFGGLVSKLFGVDSISTMSNYMLYSKYVIEYKRGEKEEISKPIKNNIVEKHLKLNIGCHDNYLEGYLNIDWHGIHNIDVQINDISKLDFEPNSVSEIIVFNRLSFLDKIEGKTLLNKIYVWLTNRGKLVIEELDTVKAAKLILKNKKNFDKIEDSPDGFNVLFNKNYISGRKWGYSEFTLTKKLSLIGFSDVKKEKPQFPGQDKKRDLRLIAFK